SQQGDLRLQGPPSGRDADGGVDPTTKDLCRFQGGHTSHCATDAPVIEMKEVEAIRPDHYEYFIMPNTFRRGSILCPVRSTRPNAVSVNVVPGPDVQQIRVLSLLRAMTVLNKLYFGNSDAKGYKTCLEQ
ncbi:hypothetical protein PoB_002777200, partial [Plakobranchus ocellatus]